MTASTAAAREPTSVAGGRSSVSTMRPSARKKSTSIVSVCHCSSAGRECGARLGVRAVDQFPHEGLQARRELVQIVGRQKLAFPHPSLEQGRDRPRERAAAPVLLRRREHGREDLLVDVGECAKEELALAPLAALEPGLRALDPVRRWLAPVGNRDHRRRAEELRAPQRRLGEGVVADLLRVAEQFDEPREVVVVLEVVERPPTGVWTRASARARSPRREESAAVCALCVHCPPSGSGGAAPRVCFDACK